MSAAPPPLFPLFLDLRGRRVLVVGGGGIAARKITALREAGAAIVVGDLVAQYKSEAFHGETLRVRMQPADFNRYGFDLVFCMTEKTSGREVARGKIGIVFIGKADRKVASIPESIRQLLLARAGTPGSHTLPERVSSPST